MPFKKGTKGNVKDAFYDTCFDKKGNEIECEKMDFHWPLKK